MTLRVSHATVSAAPDSNDGKISSTAWNQGHLLAGANNTLLGFDSSGAGQEVTVQAPLTYVGGILSTTALTGNQTVTLSGDVSGSGTTTITATLATVNSNVGSFGSTSAVPIITVNGKGLITAVSTAGLGTVAVLNSDTDGGLAADSDSNVATQKAVKTYIDNAISTVTGGGAGGVLTGFVSGGNAIWVSGLTFKVTAAQYYIGGTLYSSAEQSITLTAADPSNARIDVLALDNTGTLVKITGTASSAPSEPAIDPSSQIEVTFVTIAAAATTPTGATNENIYLEGSEWSPSVTGSHITANSTNNPRTGSKDIEATSAVTGDSILFNKGATLDPSGYTNLVFYLRNKTASWLKTSLRINFTNASGARVGAIVTVANNTFGLLTSNVSSYQAVSIPLTNFAIPAGTLVQKLNIAVNGTTAIGWYLDDMVLQSNGTGGGGSGGLTQTQADARYAQRAANLSDIANAAAALANLSGKPLAPNVQAVTSAATVTPTFSNDLVKITAQAAGLTLANWSGTAVPGWAMGIRIKDSGSAQTITYGGNYRAIGVTLPTNTVAGKVLYLGCIWNADDSKIDVVAVAQQA